MGAVKRFEDLIAWQKARDLAREIYLATKSSEFARALHCRLKYNAQQSLLWQISLKVSNALVRRSFLIFCRLQKHLVQRLGHIFISHLILVIWMSQPLSD